MTDPNKAFVSFTYLFFFPFLGGAHSLGGRGQAGSVVGGEEVPGEGSEYLRQNFYELLRTCKSLALRRVGHVAVMASSKVLIEVPRSSTCLTSSRDTQATYSDASH